MTNQGIKGIVATIVVTVMATLTWGQTIDYVGNKIVNAYENKSYYYSDQVHMQPEFNTQGNEYFASPQASAAPAFRGRDYVLNEYLNTEEKQQENIHVMTKEQKNSYYKYYDGLGRTVQYVFKEGSPSGADLIQHIEYDDFGRNAKQYLPLAFTNKGNFVSNARALMDVFYSQNGDRIANTTHPYSETKYDGTPFNRTIEQGAVGAAWNADAGGKTKKREFFTNATNEVVRWEYSGVGAIDGSQFYAVNQLRKQEFTNEENNTTIVFTDRNGRIIVLKREIEGGDYLETHYVYDEKGRLRVVIPPEAIEQLNGSYSNISGAFLDKWTFQSEYNEKGLVIKVRQPGEDWIHCVYDQYDRLRLVQDGNLRTSDEWIFVKYDRFDRVVMNGKVADSRDRQALSDALPIEDRTRYEYPSNSALYSLHGYSSERLFPNVSNPNVEIWTVNYYDSYDFADLAAFTFQHELGYANYSNRTRGVATGSKVRVMGTNTFLESIIYYNEKGRVIQQQEELLSGDIDITTQLYNFNGELNQVKHTTASPTHVQHTQTERYEYDHAGRLEQVHHSIDGNAEVVLSKLDYNEIGQMVDKSLHSEDGGTTFLQSIDFRYNERGWIESINNQNLSNDGGATNDDDNDLFGLELHRNVGLELNESQTILNGNISEVIWQSARDNKKRAFSFAYDKANRLKSATYHAYSTDWNSDVENNRFNLESVSYDKNGNITALERKGLVAANIFGTIDDLNYHYEGNQLKAVNDNVASTLNTLVDFKDNGSVGSISVPENIYDANGNLTVDGNKGAAITYNDLNLTVEVDLGNGDRITYTYDARGRRLQKQQYNNGTLYATTDYINGFEYQDHVLSHIHTSEGRVRKLTGAGHFSYEYFITDHLGNVRMVFDKDAGGNARIIQEKHFYPFGMEIQSLSFVNGSVNNITFNGTEQQTEHFLNWQDFGFRMYDAATARWNATDPLAGFYASSSPYHFANNNPIRYRDVLGLYGHDDYDDYDGWDSDYGDHADRMYGGSVEYEYADLPYIDFSNGFWFDDGSFGEIIDRQDLGENNGYLQAHVQIHTPEDLATYAEVYASIDNGSDAYYSGDAHFEEYYDDSPEHTPGAAIASGIEFTSSIGQLANQAHHIQSHGTAIPKAGSYSVNGRVYNNRYYGRSGSSLVPSVVKNAKNVAKLGRVVGKAFTVVNVASTLATVSSDFASGRNKSGTARLVVAGVTAGVAFIPVVGWGLSIGLGVADALWGDEFYDWLEED